MRVEACCQSVQLFLDIPSMFWKYIRNVCLGLVVVRSAPLGMLWSMVVSNF
jgi:hypothetical protein